MQYRREIDGLRALAVVPVILFHAGFQSFSGGFVGVDVFFVISGYLITTIIASELEQGNFSLIKFYERRARRILPALFLVMLVCIPFAWVWFFPSDMKTFAHSLAAVALFVSNILFWHESGYFAQAADFNPLLHTWSLAVEEQYYLLFPLFLMLTWRLGKRWILALLGIIFIASLGLAQWASLAKPVAGFYLLPTRGWELLMGSFAAFYLSDVKRKEVSRIASECGSGVGLLFILFSVFTYSKETPFPGIYALAPTVGAVLIIIFATNQTVIGRWMGHKALVGIGLLSYSAYLWHQPLFAFARYRNLSEPSAFVFAMLAGVAFILAYFSFRFVEIPFRRKRIFSRIQIFIFSLLASTFFLAFGYLGHATGGVYAMRTLSERMSILDARVAINYGLSAECDDRFNASKACATSENPEVLLWGDSYAMHLVQGFIASNANIKIVQRTVSVCGPFLNIAPMETKLTETWAKKCIDQNDLVFEYLKNTPSIKYVVLSSPFGQYVGQSASVLTKNGQILAGNQVSYDALLYTINSVKSLGKFPVVFSPTPRNGQNIGQCLIKATIFESDDSFCDVKLQDSNARQAPVNDLLKKIELVNPVVWLNDGLCVSGTCKAAFEGIFIYRDSGHLSHEGSAYLGGKMNFYGRLESAAGLNKK